MAKWNYTLQNGVALREAIETDNAEETTKCLLKCYKELYDKLSEEDREWKGFDIEDTIEILTYYVTDPDDEDDVNYYLQEFYDICDDVKAWISI